MTTRRYTTGIPDHLLCSFTDFLNTYSSQDAPIPDLPLPDPALLRGLPLFKLGIPDPEATRLTYVLLLIIQTATQRRQQHRQAAGGWDYLQRFRSKDLEQEPLAEARLKEMSSDELYEQVENDLLLAVRLARAAQRARWPHKEDDWQKRHVALAWVLVRLQQVYYRLRKPAWWMAETCLCHALQTVWLKLFGNKLAPSRVVYEWVRIPPLAQEQEVVIAEWLEKQQQAGHQAPPPFKPLMERWKPAVQQGVGSPRGTTSTMNEAMLY